ncbi:hypothetical protein V8E36_002341, partial [Tilletia maclaganii]
VSIFHVYGHDSDCQVKYSPRRCPGFGWTDGESLERLWSNLRDLVSLTHPMSQVNRRQTLSVRLEKIARENRENLMATLRKRLSTTLGLLDTETKALED